MTESLDRDRRGHARVAVAVGASTLALGLALRLRGETSVWLTTGVAAVIAIALALWAGRGALRDRLGVDRRRTAIGLAAGAAMSAATWLLYPLVEPWLAPAVEALYASLRDPPGPWAALPILLLVITAEELVYRDVLVTALRDRLPALTAGVVALLLYVVPQIIGGSWLLTGIAFACGVVWTGLRFWSGSVWAAWVCHVVWDVAVMLAFPVA